MTQNVHFFANEGPSYSSREECMLTLRGDFGAEKHDVKPCLDKKHIGLDISVLFPEQFPKKGWAKNRINTWFLTSFC